MYSIIMNPSSHSGEGDKRAAQYLCEELQKKQIPYCVFETKGPGHAREIADRITEDLNRRSVISDLRQSVNTGFRH